MAAGKLILAALLATGALAAASAYDKYAPYIQANLEWKRRFGNKSISKPGKVFRYASGKYILETGTCPKRFIVLYHPQANTNFEEEIASWLKNGLGEFEKKYNNLSSESLSDAALFAVRYAISVHLIEKIPGLNTYEETLKAKEKINVLAYAYFEKRMLHSDEDRQEMLNTLISMLR